MNVSQSHASDSWRERASYEGKGKLKSTADETLLECSIPSPLAFLSCLFLLT